MRFRFGLTVALGLALIACGEPGEAPATGAAEELCDIFACKDGAVLPRSNLVHRPRRLLRKQSPE